MFAKIVLELAVWKSKFFGVIHFEKKNPPKKFLFASFPWKSVNINNASRMGRNVDDYPGLQQKSVRNSLLHSVLHVLCKRPDIDFSVQDYSKFTRNMIR